MDIAIAVFSFRRPEKLRLVLEALRGAKVAKLYHFCDGPRNAADEQLCTANRQIAQSVDTGIPTEYQLLEKNIGLTQNLIGGIDHVLSKHEAIIVLEDDIVPTSQFFEFIKEGLNTFKEHSDIFSISGYNPLTREETPTGPAFLSPRFFCWGWATWATKWHSISLMVNSGASPYEHYWMVPGTAGTDFRWGVRSWGMGRKELIWDQRVALNTLYRGFHHICPSETLISNIGFDGSGENCPASSQSVSASTSINSHTKLLTDIQPDETVYRKIALQHSLPPESFAKRTRRRVNYAIRTFLNKLNSRAINIKKTIPL